MNIKELLNRMFTTKTYDIVLPNNLESIPKRDILTEDKIKVLEEYKKQYLNLLAQRRYIISYDLAVPNFNKEMNMNFSLFGRIVFNHDTVYNFNTMQEYEKQELWLKQRINPIKIALYIEVMDKIYNDTHLRLLALTEIRDEYGEELSQNKRNALCNEIYNLTGNYATYRGNVYAALTEVKTYISESEWVRNNCYKYGEGLLVQYEAKLNEYFSAFIPDRLIDTDMPIDYKLAYIERELELYTYNNLKVDNLNEELCLIDEIDKTRENRDMLIKRIEALEKKYILLNDFGGYELDLEPLYQVKFDILTIDIMNERKTPFDIVPPYGRKREYLYYEAILAKRIETNVTGADSLISHALKAKDKDVIKIISDVLINGKMGGFCYDLILENKFKLSCALSMESYEKAKYFFNNYKLDFSYDSDGNDTQLIYHVELDCLFYGYDEDKTLIFENSSVPLRTIFHIIKNIYGKGKYDKENNPKALYAKIYDCFCKSDPVDVLMVPEGITKINFPSHRSPDYERFCRAIYGKTVVMPSTLESIDINLDSSIYRDETYIPEIILNEGLQSVKAHINTLGLGIKALTIPSTLNYFYVAGGSRHINLLGVNEITFTNFEDSQILNSDKNNARNDTSIQDIVEAIYANAVARAYFVDDLLNQYKLVNIDSVKIILVPKNGNFLYRTVIDVAKIVEGVAKAVCTENVNTIIKSEHSLFREIRERACKKIIKTIKYKMSLGKTMEMHDEEVPTLKRKKEK